MAAYAVRSRLLLSAVIAAAVFGAGCAGDADSGDGSAEPTASEADAAAGTVAATVAGTSADERADAESSAATIAPSDDAEASAAVAEPAESDAATEDRASSDDGKSTAPERQQPEDERQAAEDEGRRRETEERAQRERDAAEDVVSDPCASESLPDTGTEVARTISSGGNEYQYLVYVPGGLDGPVPLVLNFHGLGGDGPGQARYTGYRKLAEREGFVVIHPSGVLIDGSQGLRSWELAQEAGLNAELDAERDDLQFVRDLLDEVTARLCIDPERVYSTGMSNGGGFSSRLACELADRIAAAFAVTLVTHPESCDPSQPLAFAAVHGTADDIVPFYGTGESPVSDLARTPEEREAFREFFSQVMPDELAEFAADFNCETTSTHTIGDATTLTTYTDCDGGVEARFYAIEGFGHEWPSLPRDDFSATEEGWAFMSRYTLSGRAG